MANATGKLTEALENHFETEWGSTTPVQWENEAFAKPNDSAWIEFRVQQGESSAFSRCSPAGSDGLNVVYPGTILINIHIPEKSGTAAKNLYMERIQDALQYRDIQGVQTRGYSVINSGYAEDKSHVTSVAINFIYYDKG